MAPVLIFVALFSTLPLAGAATSIGTNPIGKVLQLLDELKAKVVAEGTEAHKVYAEYSSWCEDRSKDLRFDIKTGKSEMDDLKATIEEEEALAISLDEKIQELSGAIATDEADLKAAVYIRGSEASDFAATESELSATVDIMTRAISILEKKGTAFLQGHGESASNVALALDALVQASEISSADASQLTSLMQNTALDQEVGAPDAAVYQGHTGDIIETLTDLLDKAKSQVSAARRTETTNINNFEILKQGINDEIRVAKNNMAKAKKGLAESNEKKAAATGDLQETTKSTETNIKALAELHQACMSKAQDYEATMKSRDEEVTAIVQARKIVAESTGGATDVSYALDQTSFVQFSSRMGSANFEAMRIIRDLAQKHRSPALAQLASRIAATISRTRSGEDPFAKVKSLVSIMIEKLQEEAEADATHHAFCDKELAETKAKEADKTAEIEKYKTKVDQMTSRSEQLKGEVAELQKALANLSKDQSEMNRLRAEEEADFAKNKADLEQGIAGVKLALKVLRDYYAKGDEAHEEGGGAASGIIGLLEVCESDFTKGLSEMIATEENAKATYDEQIKENEIEKTSKEQDVKYKVEESTGLDKAVSEATSDQDDVQSELNAVLEYKASLEKQCIAKAETYDERKGRSTSEIAGLKEALEILDGKAVLLQRSSKRSLRAVRHHIDQ